MNKKSTYKEGDLISIALSNGKYAICKIIFKPIDRLKQVVGLTILAVQDEINLSLIDNNHFIEIEVNSKNLKCIFTGNQNLKNGEWAIVSESKLTAIEKSMQWFIYANHLYHQEEFIRNANEEDYKIYPTLSVMGFVLLDNLLKEL